jgi:tRNA(fMet)-specific endonuclease VapC
MLYMLDTNVCIYAINNDPASYCNKLESLENSGHSLAISSIVLAELQFGIANSKRKEQNQIKVNAFISGLDVIDFSAKCALFYGELRFELKQKGISIGNNDLLIASHALCERATLVTNNSSEFGRVAGLKLDNWDE